MSETVYLRWKAAVLECLRLTIFAMALLSITGCGSDITSHAPSLILPPTMVGEHYQAYVETPTGSYHRLAYIFATGQLDTILPEEPPILPLPVNAGFIPFQEKDQMNRVPTWILGKRLTTGDVLSILPIGLVKYVLDQEEHIEIVAVPVDEKLSTIPVFRFRDLIIGYDPVKFNFEYWLRNQGGGNLTQLSWEDEVKAFEYLNSKSQ